MPLLGSLFGKPNINKLMEKRDVKGLIDSLGNKDLEIRGQAILALGELRDIGAAAPIFHQMADPGLEAKAIQALAGMQPDVIPFLIEKLGSKAANEGKYAAGVLKRIGVPAIQSLWNVVIKGNRYARESAANLLDEIGGGVHEDSPQPVRIAYLIAKQKFNECIQFGQAAVGLLKEYILLPDTRYSASGAIAALAMIGGDNALEAIEAVLLETDVPLGWEAARALGGMKDTRIVDVLIKALKIGKSDPNEDRRKYIVDVFKEIGDKRAAIPLAEALGAPYPHYGICQGIAETLVKINDPSVIEILVPILDYEPWNPSHFAKEAIEGLLNKSAACVIEALAGKNEKIKILAAKAAGKHGAAPAVPLLDALEGAGGDLRWYISRSLAVISKAPGIDKEIKERILKHQSVIDVLHPKCAMCGAEVSEDTAEVYDEGVNMKLFCKGACWEARGRVIGGLAGQGCPFYTKDRMCKASRPALPCSIHKGNYASSCSVYSFNAHGILPY